MRRVAASLAAVVLAAGLAACENDGAEPGASREATLVLDFTPNAVHAGIYAALAEGLFADRGIDLEVREPSASTDAPKLLEAGRAEFAILDINDLGIAREQGLEVVGIEPLVHVPLAAVIAGDRDAIRRPSALEGGTVGVTGLPSDDAVLDSVLEADGADPDQVERITIGFDSVAAISAGRVDAATAFWNAEGVLLQDRGVPTREFRVSDFGAPRYPELVVVTSEELLREEPELAADLAEAVSDGNGIARKDSETALRALAEQVDGIDLEDQSAQFEALFEARAFEDSGDPAAAVADWEEWATDHGIVEPGPWAAGMYEQP